MSGSIDVESVDSMCDVTDLQVRVLETPGGIELWVRIPVYQVSAILQPEQSEPTTEELMVGYIKDVDDLRYLQSSALSEDDKSILRYEVVLADEVSGEHAQALGVAVNQSFLVNCNDLWDCVPARPLIMQYELYSFAENHKWSARVLCTDSYQLLRSQLPTLANAEDGISQLPNIARWWWHHLGVRASLFRFMKYNVFRLKRAVQVFLQFTEQSSQRLLRTEVTFLRERPSFISWEASADAAEQVSVVGQLVFIAHDVNIFSPKDYTTSVVKGYLLACPGGHRRLFSSEHADFAKYCSPGTTFSTRVQNYQLWHVMTLDMTPDRMAANVLADYGREVKEQQYEQQMQHTWLRLRCRCQRAVIFTLNADCLLLDKKGFLRPCYKLRIVDDATFMVGTRCFKQKLRHVSQIRPFKLEHCDRLASVVDAPVLAVPDSKGPELNAEDLKIALQEHGVGGSEIEGLDAAALLAFLAKSVVATSAKSSEADSEFKPGGSQIPSTASSVSLIEAMEERAKQVDNKPSQQTLQRDFANPADMRITRCVKHNGKLYYIFTRVDGQEQKISSSGVLTARKDIKKMVADFAAWHLENFGLTIEDSLDLVGSNSSDDGNDSDSSKAMSAGLGEVLEDFTVHAGDEDADLYDEAYEVDSPPNLIADVRVESVAKAMAEHGLGNFDIYRHPAVWSESDLNRMVLAKSEDWGTFQKLQLPKLPEPMRNLIGTFCVVMEPYFDDDDIMLNMDEDERRESYFAVVCQVNGGIFNEHG